MFRKSGRSVDGRWYCPNKFAGCRGLNDGPANFAGGKVIGGVTDRFEHGMTPDFLGSDACENFEVNATDLETTPKRGALSNVDLPTENRTPFFDWGI